MFQYFNDRMASEFVNTIHNSPTLKSRIRSPSKIRRLRSLGNIVSEKVSDSFSDSELIEALIDESREEDFFEIISG